MSKVLITYLSTLTSKNPIIYSSKDCGVIEACYTNEACVKYFSMRDDTRDIDTIIAVCSPQVMQKSQIDESISAFEYFSGVARENLGDVKIIPVETDSQDDVMGVFDAIREVGSISDVYLDITGGFRNAAYTLALISRFLEFKGIQVRRVNYSKFLSPGKGEISDYTDNFRLMSLINAVSEFANFGNPKSISEFYANTDNEYIHALIRSMEDFSDSITLGKIENLDGRFSDLADKISSCENHLGKSQDEKILGEMLPIISGKFFGETGETDYLSVIDWCLDNRLLQQAITIYTEKLPDYVFEKGWLDYLGDWEKIEHLCRFNESKYSKAFYDIFLDREFRKYVILRNNVQKLTEKQALRRIEGIEDGVRRWNNIRDSFIRKGSHMSLGEAREYSKSDKRWKNERLENKRWDKETKDAFRLLMDDDKNPTLPKVNNTSFYKMLLGMETYEEFKKNKTKKKGGSDDELPTLDKKICFLKEIKKGATEKSKEWRVEITLNNMKHIGTAYVFFKQIRNETNHASDNENINSEQKRFFGAAGFEYKMNVDHLTKLLRNEIEFLRSVKLKEE